MSFEKTLSDIIIFNPKRPIKKGELRAFIDMAALPTNNRDISQLDIRAFKGGTKFKNGDTLFARITPCLENGKTAKVNNLNSDKYGHGSTEFIVMCAKEPYYDEDYVYYLARLPAFRAYAQSRMEGTSGRQRVTWQSLAHYVFNYPEKATRREAGKYLKTIDDKITLNTQTNQTLEAMAQALFQSWFVDFDPVKAKMRGELPEGMDAATAALFPDTLVESELGFIPRGWKIDTLGNHISMTKGKSYKSVELQESNTALVTLKSFKRGGGYRLDGLKEYIGKYKPEQEVKAGELVISLTDVTQAAEIVGKPALVIADPQYHKLVASLDVAILRPNTLCAKQYLYGLMSTYRFHRYAEGFATGTTVLHLSTKGISTFKFTLPCIKLIEKYNVLATPIFAKIEANILELKELTQIRDTLLPKLLSGAIDLNHPTLKEQQG